MRLLRALSVVLLLAVTSWLVIGEHDAARAQSVDDAEQKADQAADEAEAARSLLSDSASARAGIEDELADSLVRLADLNAELSRVSSELDQLRQHLALADIELESISEALTTQAIDAYVRAVSVPATAVMGTSSGEQAIVAASSIESVVSEDQAEVASLTIKRRELKRLREDYLADQAQVADLQSQADDEAAHLEELLAEADANMAAAAASARAADLAYRAALSEVDAARAREAERRREEERSTTTTSVGAPAATTTTTTVATTTTTAGTSTPPTTTTPPPPPVVGGDFPASVERWRPLVSQYFPSEQITNALTVIRCESYGDPEAYNPYSGASGLFQFLPSTWATASPRAGFAGASVFDGEANIGTAAWLSAYYASRGSDPWAAWACKP